MEVSSHLGGIPAVTAVGVVVAGLQGSVFGYLILKKLGIKQQEAVGLSVGAVSHALGTVSCMAVSYTHLDVYKRQLIMLTERHDITEKFFSIDLFAHIMNLHCSPIRLTGNKTIRF